MARIRLLKMGDGEPNSRVTHAALLDVFTGNGKGRHQEQMIAFVADLEYDLTLGRPWLAVHDPQTRWKEGVLVMDSAHCRKECLQDHRTPAIAVQDRKQLPEERKHQAEGYDIQEISCHAMQLMAQRADHEVYHIWVQNVSATREAPLKAFATSSEDFEKFMQDKPLDEDVRAKLPTKYYD